MGVYAVTGSASGMGRAVVEKLTAAGHTVVGVDLQGAEVVADLSTAEGRRHAVQRVLELSGGKLDGAVLAAGVGPTPDPGRLPLIGAVNYLGVVELLDGWRSALAVSGHAKVVVFGSNSTTTTPAVPKRTIKALLSGDVDKAVRSVRFFGGKASAPMMYAGSKIAVTWWARRHATTKEWAGAGIRLNVLAPGAIMTPLLEKQLATPLEAKTVRRFPVPVGGFGDAGQLGDWVVFMLSDSANFLCGSVVFVDGGSDAYFRPDAWPRPVPISRIGRYAWRFLRYPGNG
ncbi:MAG: SDR family oxidoreductase [Nocardiaceae bacterium]|nr:SDR family oxidoreductase [Nocardiaceae bacterium]